MSRPWPPSSHSAPRPPRRRPHAWVSLVPLDRSAPLVKCPPARRPRGRRTGWTPRAHRLAAAPRPLFLRLIRPGRGPRPPASLLARGETTVSGASRRAARLYPSADGSGGAVSRWPRVDWGGRAGLPPRGDSRVSHPQTPFPAPATRVARPAPDDPPRWTLGSRTAALGPWARLLFRPSRTEVCGGG